MDLSRGMTRYSARKVALTIMRKWYWLFIFAVLFAMLISAFYWYRVYASRSVSATFIPVAQNSETGAASLSKFSVVASASLLKNEGVLEAVSKSLDFDVSIRDLDEAIAIEMNELAAAVTIKVTWGDQAQANAILEAYKANLTYAVTHTANAGAIRWMNAQPEQGPPKSPVRTLSFAVFLIGALAGVLVGAVFAYFVGSLDKRVFDLDKVYFGSDVLVIGAMGKEAGANSRPAAAHRHLSGRRDRQLLASALYLNKLMEAQDKKLLMCVSPTRKCGTSTVVMKIAQILSGIQMKTLIVTVKNKTSKEAPQEKPAIKELSAGIDQCACVWDAAESNRSVVGEISSLLSEAMKNYSLILVDCPALLENIEISVFAGGMDATLMVCRYGRTRYDDVTYAAELLFRAEARPVYCIWNDAPWQYGKNIRTLESTDERRVAHVQSKNIGVDVHL